MTDTRWIIDDGTLYSDDAGVMIVPWEHSLDVGNAYFPPAAVAALVQCVRDAETLAKARELAARWDEEDATILADLIGLLTADGGS